jgi:hypothetical protein
MGSDSPAVRFTTLQQFSAQTTVVFYRHAKFPGNKRLDIEAVLLNRSISAVDEDGIMGGRFVW